jgi:hypothetical protein
MVRKTGRGGRHLEDEGLPVSGCLRPGCARMVGRALLISGQITKYCTFSFRPREVCLASPQPWETNTEAADAAITKSAAGIIPTNHPKHIRADEVERARAT